MSCIAYYGTVSGAESQLQQEKLRFSSLLMSYHNAYHYGHMQVHNKTPDLELIAQRIY